MWRCSDCTHSKKCSSFHGTKSHLLQLLFYFWHRGPMYPRLSSELLCSWGWPRTSGPPASVSCVLRLQICTTMLDLFLLLLLLTKVPEAHRSSASHTQASIELQPQPHSPLSLLFHSLGEGKVGRGSCVAISWASVAVPPTTNSTANRRRSVQIQEPMGDILVQAAQPSR